MKSFLRVCALLALVCAVAPAFSQSKSSSTSKSSKSKTSGKTTAKPTTTKSAAATTGTVSAPATTPAAQPSAQPAGNVMPAKTTQPAAPATPAAPAQLSQSDAADGIREALSKGIGKAVEVVSKTDGYLKNPLIKIPFPPEAKAVEDAVRKVGLGSQADQVVESLNRAAENAATGALSIFLDAIKGLTLTDALAIVQGSNERAATDFLQRTTSKQLSDKFKPVIGASLDKVDATKYWGTAMGTYNKIPFTQKINPDLPQYVTDKAIEGLFTMVAQEEKEIRKNPLARTTDILKKVFDFKF